MLGATGQQGKSSCHDIQRSNAAIKIETAIVSMLNLFQVNY